MTRAPRVVDACLSNQSLLSITLFSSGEDTKGLLNSPNSSVALTSYLLMAKLVDLVLQFFLNPLKLDKCGRVPEQDGDHGGPVCRVTFGTYTTRYVPFDAELV